MLRNLAIFLSLSLLCFAGAQLPPGFSDTAYASGLSQPVAIAFAPDGRLFIALKPGVVRVVGANGGLLTTAALSLPVSSNSERGLLGIAFDPQFPTRPYVYLYYTTSVASLDPPATPKNRVSRFTVDGNTILPASEVILLDEIPSDAGNHNAGCVRFGPDGLLYISTGDGGSIPGNSQDLTNLAGKILRIAPDGSIPESNPFFGQANRRWEIFCYGLRNPFRFSIRPGTNVLYIGDVGHSEWEEVNVGLPGANYGWPQSEGPTSAPGVVPPAFAYPHTETQRASITGGVFVTRGGFPLPYHGSYFYADFVRDVIRRSTFSSGHEHTGDFAFALSDGVVDFAEGADGALYYVSIGTGAVRRIAYAADLTGLAVNPTAVVGGAKSTGTVTLNRAAPAGGAAVALSCTAGSSVPSQVTVPSGATSASFSVNTSATSIQRTVTITASRNGIQQQTTLTVNPTPNAEFLSQSVPATMFAGESYNVSVTMRNNGPTTWSDAAGYRLSSYNPVNNTTWGGNRMFLLNGATVPPGGQYTFTRRVTAPSTPGTYNFQWRMLLNGFRTFGEPSANVAVSVVLRPNDADFISQTVPTSVAPGATFNASMTFRNTGSATWTNEAGYRLASRSPADNTTWGTNRVFLPSGVSVAPGASHTFSRTFRAPTTPGVFTFQWKMLHNGSGTFGEPSTAVQITVG